MKITTEFVIASLLHEVAQGACYHECDYENLKTGGMSTLVQATLYQLTCKNDVEYLMKKWVSDVDNDTYFEEMGIETVEQLSKEILVYCADDDNTSLCDYMEYTSTLIDSYRKHRDMDFIELYLTYLNATRNIDDF